VKSTVPTESRLLRPQFSDEEKHKITQEAIDLVCKNTKRQIENIRNLYAMGADVNRNCKDEAYLMFYTGVTFDFEIRGIVCKLLNAEGIVIQHGSMDLRRRPENRAFLEDSFYTPSPYLFFWVSFEKIVSLELKSRSCELGLKYLKETIHTLLERKKHLNHITSQLVIPRSLQRTDVYEHINTFFAKPAGYIFRTSDEKSGALVVQIEFIKPKPQLQR